MMTRAIDLSCLGGRCFYRNSSINGAGTLRRRRTRTTEFLQVIADPEHEHESTLRWAGGAFDPVAFDPATVKFDDPKQRWKKAFGRRP